ncbi:MAG: FlgD immunoglobulin-like domain containing protein [Candidatus Zixiibacteriota bacterium]
MNNSFKIINSLIYNNHANDMGGGIFVHSDSEAQIINTTVHNNHADDGGDGIHSEEENDNLVIFNCILWGNGEELVNCSATYSDIQGGWPGEGNIDADPLFVDPDNGDYHLQIDSPCIDAGTSDGAPPTDKDGNPRDEFPDMGVYEYQNATIVCKTDKPIYKPWERVQVLADVDNPGSSFSANLLGGIIVVRTSPKKPFILTGEVVTETIDPGLNPDIPLYNSPPIITAIAPKVTHGAFCVLYTGEDGILAIDTSTWGLESPSVAQEQFFSNFIRSYIDRYGLENLMNANNEHLLAAPSSDMPLQSALGSAFPNTANPETWFPFQLSEPGEVKFQIYNASGQLVKTLDIGYKEAGYYLDKEKATFWNGKNDRGERVASGIYFYTMRAGNFTATGKVVILK